MKRIRFGSSGCTSQRAVTTAWIQHPAGVEGGRDHGRFHKPQDLPCRDLSIGGAGQLLFISGAVADCFVAISLQWHRRLLCGYFLAVTASSLVKFLRTSLETKDTLILTHHSWDLLFRLSTCLQTDLNDLCMHYYRMRHWSMPKMAKNLGLFAARR